ncbi:hypothetical protein M3Y97_00229900 [Aphelenchoides bicaudatus]|nr:hypothetical protein M3Y97_00229900 [Aphelenchoides bicaudatus]
MVDDSAEYVVAKYDYTRREPHELSIKKSERLRIISDQHNWWKVVNSVGEVGFVPSNYLKKQSLTDKAKETFKSFGRSRSKNSLNAEETRFQVADFPSIPTTVESAFPAQPNSILKKTANNFGGGTKLRAHEMPDVVSYAVAKFNYEPQRDDELKLTKGDYLSIVDKSADGWWRVLNESGSSGWIPSNYVDETSGPPQSTAPAQDFSAPTNGSSQLEQSYQYNNGMPNFSNGRVLEVVVALYSFDAQNSEELSFRKGEQLDIVDHPAHDPDWYKARNQRGRNRTNSNKLYRGCRQKSRQLCDNKHNFSEHVSDAVLTGPYAGEPWYFGQISREQSDTLLNANGIEGDFLVRDSESNPGDYSISLKGNLRNKHFWVQICGGSYKIGNRTFNSMQQLIQHYTKSPIFSNDSTNERLYLVRPLPK